MELKWRCERPECETWIRVFLESPTNEVTIEELNGWIAQIREHSDKHLAESLWNRVCKDEDDPKGYGWYNGVPGVIGLIALALVEKGRYKTRAVVMAGKLVEELRTDTATLRVVGGIDADQLLKEAIKYAVDAAFNECESRLWAAWKILKEKDWQEAG